MLYDENFDGKKVAYVLAVLHEENRFRNNFSSEKYELQKAQATFSIYCLSKTNKD